MGKEGDINRDWTVVDWRAVRTNFDKRIAVSATVNGQAIREYDFSSIDLSPEASRLLNDMLAALNQHRGRLAPDRKLTESRPVAQKNSTP